MGLTLAIDCDFESAMKQTEISSLGQQLMFCYGANRRAQRPATLRLVGLVKQGALHRRMLNITGFGRWLGTDIDYRLLEEVVGEDVSMRSRVVYLTADSSNELVSLDASAIYVIGGLVDRNRHKGMTASKAERLGVNTAKLPIGRGKPLDVSNYSPVLTVNQVVEILLHVQSTGSWASAATSLPGRKSRLHAPGNSRKAKLLQTPDMNAAKGDDDHGAPGAVRVYNQKELSPD